MALDERIDRINALRDRIRNLLEGQKQRLHEQIRAYPTPIPRCDEQFNHLIERRELLFRELARFDAAALGPAAAGDAEWLDRFVDSSGCLDHDTRAELKALLRRGFARIEQSQAEQRQPGHEIAP